MKREQVTSEKTIFHKGAYIAYHNYLPYSLLLKRSIGKSLEFNGNRVMNHFL